MARWSNTLRCWCGLREGRSVAEIALVDTSLRDGNQSTWAAVGIDTAKTLTVAPVMDRVGFKAIVFTLSPIHDDRHYAQAARKLAACPEVDAIYIKDPGGLLSPRRAATLIPAVQAEIGTKPLELHSHCTIGLGELLYMDAVDYGVSALQCASGATADGISKPPSLRVEGNLRALCHTVPVDMQALTDVNRVCPRIGL